jgi:hypothetical protein
MVAFDLLVISFLPNIDRIDSRDTDGSSDGSIDANIQHSTMNKGDIVGKKKRRKRQLCRCILVDAAKQAIK